MKKLTILMNIFILIFCMCHEAYSMDESDPYAGKQFDSKTLKDKAELIYKLQDCITEAKLHNDFFIRNNLCMFMAHNYFWEMAQFAKKLSEAYSLTEYPTSIKFYRAKKSVYEALEESNECFDISKNLIQKAQNKVPDLFKSAEILLAALSGLKIQKYPRTQLYLTQTCFIEHIHQALCR